VPARRQASIGHDSSRRTLIAAVALVLALVSVGTVSAMTYYGGRLDRQQREQQRLRAALTEVQQAQAAPQILAPSPERPRGVTASRSRAEAGTGVEAGVFMGAAGQDGADGADGLDGADGADGLDGADGVPGAAGAAGAKGDTGEQGAQGPQGIQGLQGDGGVAGSKGDKGDTGEQGAQGVQGDPGVAGPKGDKGDKGDTGDTGAQGLQGIQGLQGDPGVAGPKGDTGDQGLQGLQGIQGVQGDPGMQGVQGVAGPKGDKGDTGDTGAQGAQGIQGVQGIQGIQGIQGVQGDPGVAGAKGDKGDKGDTGERGPQGTPSSGAWQEIYRTTVPRGSSNGYGFLVLPVSGSGWRSLRVTVIGAATNYTSNRILAVSVNGSTTPMWEGDGAYRIKGNLASPSAAWSLNYSGAGDVHTGTALSAHGPVGVLAPETTSRLHGTVTVTQDDLLTSYSSDMWLQRSGTSVSRFLTNGYAAYTTAITEVDFYKYNVSGTFILEGLVP